MRMAFIGFRHGHAMGLYRAAASHAKIEIVAACEEDAATAESLRKEGKVTVTHTDYRRMLETVACDAVAVGDYYEKRGRVVIDALGAGKHVIADKPLCIRMGELDRIAALAREKRRSVGLLLDLRSSGSMRTARRLVREGAIGEVQTVMFSAQHPLMYGSRPGWYFEPGKHGGTINDIGIHAFDAIPWITGRRITGVVASRAWNARLPKHPEFQDAAQFMLKLDNGGGVMGDVSYLAPEGCGYVAPQYWRFTLHGSEGMLEFDLDRTPVLMARNPDKAVVAVKSDGGMAQSAIESFLREATGAEGERSPGTEEVLAASRVSLAVQRAADAGRRDVKTAGEDGRSDKE